MTWFCHYDWKRNYKPHAQGQQIRILPARDVLKVTHPSKLKALWLKGNVPGKRKFTAASNEGRLAAGCVHESCRPQLHQRALQASVRRTSRCQVSICCEHMVQVTKKPNDANSFWKFLFLWFLFVSHSHVAQVGSNSWVSGLSLPSDETTGKSYHDQLWHSSKTGKNGFAEF